MKETTLQTSRSVKKEGGGGARDARSETSLVARDEDHGEAVCPPAVHGGP